MARKKKEIHRSNCTPCVRLVTQDAIGNTITVCGRYAFEWSINIQSGDCITQMTFKCRKDAMKELKKRKG